MDPALLHEDARHTIHSTETLAATQELVKALSKEHESLQDIMRQQNSGAFKAERRVHRYIQQKLDSHAVILEDLRLRSDSNTKRLLNENSLVSVLRGTRRMMLLILLGTESHRPGGQPCDNGDQQSSRKRQQSYAPDHAGELFVPPCNVCIGRKKNAGGSQCA